MFHRKKNKELLANYRVLAEWVNIYLKEYDTPVPDIRLRQDARRYMGRLLKLVKDKDIEMKW